MRVLWVVIDALGNDQVTPEWMPRLCALADEGGRAPAGGISVLPALTYPNHATFVTGVEPHDHGIVTNSVPGSTGWVGAETVGPRAPTVFDRLTPAGRRSVGVFGDQNLVGVCGAAAASRHWPTAGVLDPSIRQGLTGYAADVEVLEAACAMGVAEFDLALVQFDETDAVRHVYGPDSPEAAEQALAVDGTLEALLSLYAGCWDDTVVVVLSDHDQEPVVPGAAVDLEPDLDDLLASGGGRWRGDGTAAWFSSDTGISSTQLAGVTGVAGVAALADGALVAWGEPGVVFGLDWGQGGDHGSPRTSSQVAVVGGGHPSAVELGARIGRHAPRAVDWAPWVLGMLGMLEEG